MDTVIEVVYAMFAALKMRNPGNGVQSHVVGRLAGEGVPLGVSTQAQTHSASSSNSAQAMFNLASLFVAVVAAVAGVLALFVGK